MLLWVTIVSALTTILALYQYSKFLIILLYTWKPLLNTIVCEVEWVKMVLWLLRSWSWPLSRQLTQVTCYVPRHLAHIFSFLSWLICTYMITWSRLTWLITCIPEPPHWELHCSLLLYISYCSLLMVVCDHHCSWRHCSMTLIVHDSIVLPFCMLSQVAALLYISWTYILELGLKPDLVCNLLRSQSLLLEQTFSFYLSLKLSSTPWRYFPFLFIFTQTLVLMTLSPLLL